MNSFKCKNCRSSFPIYEMECVYCGYKRSQFGLIVTVAIMLVVIIISFEKYF